MAAGTSFSDLQAFIAEEEARLADTELPLPFDRNEYAARLEKLRGMMSAAEIDVLVLTAPDTMCWLHGYNTRWYRWHSSTALPPIHATVVHRDRGDPFLVDTGYHADLIRLTSCIDDVRPIPATSLIREATTEEFVGFLVGEIKSQGWLDGVVGLELWSCVPNPHVTSVMTDSLRDAGCQVVDATRGIRRARRLKSAQELAVIERAAIAADAGLQALREGARAGMTELEACSLVASGVAGAGGEPGAIPDLVFAGSVDAYVHGAASRRPIEAGEYFHADTSVAVDRYHVRATRPFFIGDPPPELVRLAAIAAGSRDVLIETAKVGMPFRELNAALSGYFRTEGFSDETFFAGGYELGISFPPDFVGEFLWSSHDDQTDDVIENGLVTDFETASFVAMVDTVVFEDAGARLLSEVPSDLVTIDR